MADKTLIEKTDDFMLTLLSKGQTLLDVNDQADIAKVLISWIQVKNKIQPEKTDEGSKIDEYRNALKKRPDSGRARSKRTKEDNNGAEAEEITQGRPSLKFKGFRGLAGAGDHPQPAHGSFPSSGGSVSSSLANGAESGLAKADSEF